MSLPRRRQSSASAVTVLQPTLVNAIETQTLARLRIVVGRLVVDAHAAQCRGMWWVRRLAGCPDKGSRAYRTENAREEFRARNRLLQTARDLRWVVTGARSVTEERRSRRSGASTDPFGLT